MEMARHTYSPLLQMRVQAQSPLSVAHLQLHLQVQQIDFRLLHQDIPQSVFPFHRVADDVLHQWPQIYPAREGGRVRAVRYVTFRHRICHHMVMMAYFITPEMCSPHGQSKEALCRSAFSGIYS